MNIKLKSIICTVLVALLVSSVLTSSAVAGTPSETSPVGDPVPAVSISVSTDNVHFGDLRPGQASDAAPVVVTNDGISAVNLTATVEDDGEEDIFESGITINDKRWDDYYVHIASDEDEIMNLVLNVPGDVASRGEVKGSLTLWAEALPLSTVDFFADTTYGFAPLAVHFTGQSSNTNPPTSWAWDFNNNGTIDSTEQNPSWTYSEAGTYTVTLTVTNAAGTDTVTKTAYIEVVNYGTLKTSTYLGGGAGEDILYNAVTVAPDGTVYVAGSTQSSDLSTEGAYDTSHNGGYDAFIARFSPDLSQLLNCTYFGGSADDYAVGIAVGSDGTVYVTGYTTSADLPADGHQKTTGGANDAFVARFSADLSELEACTYFGGAGVDWGCDLTVADDGTVYLVGQTPSPNLATDGAYQPAVSGANDAFVARFSADLSQLFSCTYFGGSLQEYGYSIALADDGTVYIAGYTTSSNMPAFNSHGGNNDAFLAKFNADLSELITSRYFGGSGSDTGYELAIAPNGSVYITGNTASNNLLTDNPSVTGYQTSFGGGAAFGDVYVAKFSASLGLQACTYLGGSSMEVGYSVAVGDDGTVYVAGYNTAGNFPVKDAYQAATAGSMDAIIAAFSSDLLFLRFSTYLGGSSADQAFDIALDADGNLIVVGKTASTNFPTVNAVDEFRDGTNDLFVAVLLLTCEPTARFSADLTEVASTLPVQFTDLSANSPTAWAWDFDGDGTIDSTEQNPSWTYSEAGTYTVTLTVTNAAGTDTVTRTGYIKVST